MLRYRNSDDESAVDSQILVHTILTNQRVNYGFMKNLMNAASLSVFLICSLFASGCAFGTRQAKITYPPTGSQGEKVGLIGAPAGSHGEIVLEKFNDDRADKTLVGHVRNGYGIKTAKVVGEPDLTSVVNEAVRCELVRAGYAVQTPADATATNTPVISGALVKLYCDAYMSYEGTASIYVRITRDGKEILRKTYEGQGSAGMNWAMTGASYGLSLSLAIQDALEKLKLDLPAALKQ